MNQVNKKLQELFNLMNDSYTESFTGGVKSINTDHAYIHDGIAFKASLDIGALTAQASESYSFKTPEAKYIHFKNLRLSGKGASVRAKIVRGTTGNPLTVDSAGESATELVGPSNLNDNSSKASGVVIKKSPTYTNGESGEIWDFITISGESTAQFQSTSESQGNVNEELVMQPDTYYVLTITNLSAQNGDGATDVVLTGFWYEEARGI